MKRKQNYQNYYTGKVLIVQSKFSFNKIQNSELVLHSNFLIVSTFIIYVDNRISRCIAKAIYLEKLE